MICDSFIIFKRTIWKLVGSSKCIGGIFFCLYLHMISLKISSKKLMSIIWSSSSGKTQILYAAYDIHLITFFFGMVPSSSTWHLLIFFSPKDSLSSVTVKTSLLIYKIAGGGICEFSSILRLQSVFWNFSPFLPLCFQMQLMPTILNFWGILWCPQNCFAAWLHMTSSVTPQLPWKTVWKFLIKLNIMYHSYQTYHKIQDFYFYVFCSSK